MDYAQIETPENKEAVNYYQVLGLSEDASVEEIKKKWLKLSLIYHPDKNRDDPKATEKYRQINQAYKVLSNPENREKYNQGLAKDYDQLRVNRETGYQRNLQFINPEDRSFDRDKFMKMFKSEISTDQEEKFSKPSLDNIEKMLEERNNELNQFEHYQKTQLYDPKNHLDDFNRVFESVKINSQVNGLDIHVENPDAIINKYLNVESFPTAPNYLDTNNLLSEAIQKREEEIEILEKSELQGPEGISSSSIEHTDNLYQLLLEERNLAP